MIQIKYLFFAFLLLFITACSDDDDSSDSNNDDPVQENPLSGDFFPSSSSNNEWNFDVVDTDNQTGDIISTNDRLFIETADNSNFSLGVNTNNVATGTMNTILTNGTLSKTETTLSTTGQLSIEIDGLEDINIPYEDAILYNLQALDGKELFNSSGSLTQEVQSFPVTVDYKITTSQVKNFKSITINGKEYSDVNQSTFIINMSVDVIVISSQDPFPLVDEQESIVITSYFAKDIGLVQSETSTSIVPNSDTIALLQSLPDVDTSDIPSEISTTNIQNLTSFTAN